MPVLLHPITSASILTFSSGKVNYYIRYNNMPATMHWSFDVLTKLRYKTSAHLCCMLNAFSVCTCLLSILIKITTFLPALPKNEQPFQCTEDGFYALSDCEDVCINFKHLNFDTQNHHVFITVGILCMRRRRNLSSSKNYKFRKH